MPDGSSEEKKSIGVALIQNTALAMVVIGVSLAVIAAAGGLPKFSMNITDKWSRLAIGVLGVACAVVGVVRLQPGAARSADKINPTKYGLRIDRPDGDVRRQWDITGRYTSLPLPEAGTEVWVFEFSPTSQTYYPKRPITINGNDQWKSDACHMKGDPGTRRDIVVAIVGAPGLALIDYHRKVGEETKRWVGIKKLTPDIVECDRITVTIKAT
jgi:hypothetical protein